MTQLEAEDLETLLQYLKTLADQTRLRILGLVATQKRSVEELATLLDLKSSTVSWHLGRLKDLDLVTMTAEGTTHLYRMNGRGLRRINHLLATPERMALLTQTEEQAWDHKVLRDFLEEGRLKEIPAYRKKRQIILRWLVQQFEEGRRYPELELNEIIKRYHPDTATLRRELIGERLMARDHGVYWRLPASSEPPSREESSDEGA